jgi:NAD(P)-dependent dehydrogenase (short-subunit alcohol dehydrogenase family)
VVVRAGGGDVGVGWESPGEFEGLGGIKLGRFGNPQEIANLVVFLVSDAASWITVTDAFIDGGLVKTL